MEIRRLYTPYSIFLPTTSSIVTDLSLLAIFGTSFLVGLSGATTPGPLLAYSIRETVRRGFVAGPTIALGHSALELVTVVLLAVGLKRIPESDPIIAFIGIVGGTFLLWMGWGILRNPSQGAPTADGQIEPPRRGNLAIPFLGGIVISLSNPFFTIWWMTIGIAFMTESLQSGIPGVAAFYLGHILSDIGWYSLVSAGVASGRRFIKERLYTGIMQACGFFIVVLGLFFIATGMTTLG